MGARRWFGKRICRRSNLELDVRYDDAALLCTAHLIGAGVGRVSLRGIWSIQGTCSGHLIFDLLLPLPALMRYTWDYIRIFNEDYKFLQLFLLTAYTAHLLLAYLISRQVHLADWYVQATRPVGTGTVCSFCRSDEDSGRKLNVQILCTIVLQK